MKQGASILPNELEELYPYLFSFLDPEDLFNLNLVNKATQSHTESHNLWQSLIQQHFPLLEKTHNEEYTKNPKALFIKEYEKGVYGRYYGASNKIFSGSALVHAAERDNPSAVRYLLKKHPNISSGDKKYAFEQAAVKGYLSVVQLLLKECPWISYAHRNEVARNAREHGHDEVANFIYNSIESQTIANDFFDLLNGHASDEVYQRNENSWAAEDPVKDCLMWFCGIFYREEFEYYGRDKYPVQRGLLKDCLEFFRDLSPVRTYTAIKPVT